MSKLAVIIPVFELWKDEHRAKAFHYVWQQAQQRLKPNVFIFPEQVKAAVPSYNTSIFPPKNGKRLRIETSDALFHKAQCINAAVKAVPDHVVLILDADVVLDWEAVSKAAQILQPGSVCKPFSKVIRLSQHNTRAFCKHGKLANLHKEETVNVLGGGAVLMHASDFTAVGGYDERYVGWGVEDEAFGRTCSTQLQVTAIESVAYHLWHPRDQQALMQTDAYKKNRDIYHQTFRLAKYRAGANVVHSDLGVWDSKTPNLMATVVIPVPTISDHTELGLVHLIRYMLSSKCIQDVVVCSYEPVVLDLIDDRLKYLVIPKPNTGIANKAYLLNQAIMQINSEYIWINEPDVWVPYDTVVSQLDKPVLVAINPISSMVCLSPEESATFFVDASIDVAEHPHRKITGYSSLIIDRGVFLWMRGYSEHMKTWGTFEQTDFEVRLNNTAPVIHLEGVGLKLWCTEEAPVVTIDHLQNRLKAFESVEASLKAKQFYESPSIVESSIPYEWTQEYITDTAVVIVCYGNDPVRTRCNSLALRDLARMNRVRPNFYVLELVIDDEDPVYDKVCAECDFNHVLVKGTDKHRGLFQKEALYNLAFEWLMEDNIILCDADFFNTNPDWVAETVKVLNQYPNACVQPYSKFFDKRAKYASWTLSAYIEACDQERCVFWGDLYKGIYAQPGGTWAFKRQMILKDGLNPFFITGSGDVGFCREYIDREVYLHAMQKQIYRDLVRPGLNTHPCKCVHATMMHSYHGDYTERAYQWSRESFGYFGSVLLYVETDPDTGLVQWKDPNNPLRWALSKKAQMQSKETTEATIMWAMQETKRRELQAGIPYRKVC